MPKLISMPLRALRFALALIREGKSVFLLRDAWTRLYKAIYEIWFFLAWRVPGRVSPYEAPKLSIETQHPVASESLDHIIPTGTARDNSTNKRFVLYMNRRIRSHLHGRRPTTIDLGCSGGQLVKDFRDLGWVAVGLEGSDYSSQNGRANWPALGGKHLFTCDITEPYTVKDGDDQLMADLITAWEVLEHIPGSKLSGLFANVEKHLALGGIFVATTTSEPAIENGVNLHQSMMSNAEWTAYVLGRMPHWTPLALPLHYYEYVRHNAEKSFLVFQKVVTVRTQPNTSEICLDDDSTPAAH